MNSRAVLGAVLALAVGGATYFLWPKEKLSPEDEVRALIARMVAAAERKNPGDVVDGLAEAFRGPGGAGKQEVKQLLVGQFFRAHDIVVLNPLLDVEIASPTRATFSGKFVLTRDGQAATYDFTGDLERGDDGWRIVTAAWQR